MKKLPKTCAYLWFLMLIPAIFASDPLEKARDFLAENQPKAKLLILGTFHFKDAGLDGYKPQHNVDILSPKRQAEVKEVVNLLAAFKPTKVALEWRPSRQEKVNQQYNSYLEGNFELKSNEVYQLGFRLAKQVGLSQVHLVDAEGRWHEKVEDPAEFAKKYGQKALLDPTWDNRYKKYYQFKDAQKMKMDLRSFFLATNTPEALRRSHGHYFVSGFAIGDGESFPGVDGFISSWYNRNLRIFSNILRLVASPQERVVLIIGSGHAPILHHAAENSPEIELIQVAEVLGKK